MDVFESIFQRFSLGEVQNMRQLAMQLAKHGFTLDDLFERLDTQVARIQAANTRDRREVELNKVMRKNVPRCPSCGRGERMVVRQAHPPDPATEDPGDPSEGCYWVCPKCRWSTYDTRPLDEIIALVRKGEYKC